jgi:hypothetical protein
MPLSGRTLRTDEWLSQYLSHPLEEMDRSRPRASDLDGLSLQLGLISPKQACWTVRRRAPTSRDGVRYVRVGTLQGLGFTVLHTPNPRNEFHVSVTYFPVWDDEVAARFEGAFMKPVWHADEEGGV